MTFRGRVWRHVPVGKEPLHLGAILKAGLGRWNIVSPRLPCLYTALDPRGAIADIERRFGDFGAVRCTSGRRESDDLSGFDPRDRFDQQWARSRANPDGVHVASAQMSITACAPTE